MAGDSGHSRTRVGSRAHPDGVTERILHRSDGRAARHPDVRCESSARAQDEQEVEHRIVQYVQCLGLSKSGNLIERDISPRKNQAPTNVGASLIEIILVASMIVVWRQVRLELRNGSCFKAD